MSLLLDWLSKV